MNKTRFANAELVQTWAKQCQSFGQNATKSLHFNGRELISYNTTIAVHYGDFVLKSADSFSTTTAKHLSLIGRSTAVPVIAVDLFTYAKRLSVCADFPAGSAIIIALVGNCRTIAKRYANRRAKATKELDLRMLNMEIANLHLVCNRLNLAYPAKDLISIRAVCRFADL